MRIDETTHFFIIFLWHNQTKSKIVQNLLNGVFPIFLAILHSNEFANEWYFFWSSASFLQNHIPNFSFTARDIVLIFLKYLECIYIIFNFLFNAFFFILCMTKILVLCIYFGLTIISFCSSLLTILNKNLF